MDRLVDVVIRRANCCCSGRRPLAHTMPRSVVLAKYMQAELGLLACRRLLLLLLPKQFKLVSVIDDGWT